MKTVKFRVHCALAECYYYLTEDIGGTKLIFCTYPERDLASDERPCPYYRMDWAKKLKLVQQQIQANKAARMKAEAPTVTPAPETAPASAPPSNGHAVEEKKKPLL